MSEKHEEIVASQSELQHEFNIQRIYTKDISYEAPSAPDIFHIEWSPQVDLNLHTDSKKLSEDTYEVILQITVTVKLKDKTAFLVEVKQAGIFTLKNFTTDQIDPMLGSFCPNILFPYARELISETVCRGSFPPLYLAPINFDAFYHEQLQQRKNAS
ncbi:MAG: hypothetical protein ACD_69C00274G0003 [uncultured bacterium]|nr:MAG: hypothetical protein ACD_69C00274G0003 [uncultured bacterium]